MSPDGPVAPAAGPSLWAVRDFRLLWAGDAVSQVGSQLSSLALPVLAVKELGAGELEMGLLAASGTLAFLVVGLPAGAWVDRLDKRRVLVVTDLVRALALALLPLALWLGDGAMWQLFAAALVTGTCTVFFDVAWQSVLPQLVEPEQLVPANARLQATESVAHVVGPALGGQLLRLLGAPLVVAVDAVSFACSALLVGAMRPRRAVSTEEEAEAAGEGASPMSRSLRRDIAEGLAFVVRHPLLSRITACTALANLGGAMASALFVLYVLRDLDISQGMLGLVFALGSAGGIVGALVAARLARIVGEGRLIVIALVPTVPALAITPLVSGLAPLPAAALLAAGSAVMAAGGVIYNITQVSFRQRLCPPRLLGRMNASVRFLVFGTLPLGSVLGGALGATIGVQPTLWIAVAAAAASLVPVAASPLRSMRELPSV